MKQGGSSTGMQYGRADVVEGRDRKGYAQLDVSKGKGKLLVQGPEDCLLLPRSASVAFPGLPSPAFP